MRQCLEGPLLFEAFSCLDGAYYSWFRIRTVEAYCELHHCIAAVRGMESFEIGQLRIYDILDAR